MFLSVGTYITPASPESGKQYSRKTGLCLIFRVMFIVKFRINVIGVRLLEFQGSLFLESFIKRAFYRRMLFSGFPAEHIQYALTYNNLLKLHRMRRCRFRSSLNHHNGKTHGKY